MRVYLAGPMTRIASFNHPAFVWWANYLRSQGHDVFNPAEYDLSTGFDPTGMTGHENLAEHGFDLRTVALTELTCITQEAEGVFLLPGWRESRGARAEFMTSCWMDLEAQEAGSGTWVKAREIDFDGSDPEPVIETPVTLAAASGMTPELRSMLDRIESTGRIAMVIPGKDGKPTVASCIPTQPFDSQDPGSTFAALPTEIQSRLANFTGMLGFVAPPASNGRAQAPVESKPSAIVLPATTPLPGGEVRTTDPTTGAMKGVKPERLDLIPPEILWELGRLYGAGAEKYAAWNFRKGYDWSKSYAALMRHLTQFWAGQDIDPEMRTHHMASVIFHAIALFLFTTEHPELDDRPHTHGFPRYGELEAA